MSVKLNCPECNSHKILKSVLQGDPVNKIYFQGQKTKFTINKPSSINISTEFCCCINCGLLWSRVKTEDINDHLDCFGNEEMKRIQHSSNYSN